MLRTPDLIALVYFAYIVVAAFAVRDVPGRRRVKVAALASAAMVAVVAAAFLLDPGAASAGTSHPDARSATSVIRDWLPVAWLLLGYWLPGGLLHETMPGLEAWLRASDRWMQEGSSMAWVRALPAWMTGLLELAYFLVHVFVPAGLVVLLIAGLDASDSFWTPTLLAGYACYGTLPWLQARPPRLVEPDLGAPAGAAAAAGASGAAGHGTARVRGWNVRLLDRVSVQANTFPSGHVAVAVVVALVVFDLEPAAGLVFLPLALLIATATVIRRYHYTADVALGLVVAVVCWAAARG